MVFAEDPNDAQALDLLIRYLDPAIARVVKPRRPLVLMRGRLPQAVNDQAQRIKQQVRDIEIVQKMKADLIVAHEDCDAVEPAHEQLKSRIEQALRKAGVGPSVAATPAWEFEAWWYLWPDAVASVCPGWRHLNFSGNIGNVTNVKERLRRDLRPKGVSRVPDYDETHAPRIAREVLNQKKPPSTKVQSASFEAFRASLLHQPPR